jgi:hypothetical protein
LELGSSFNALEGKLQIFPNDLYATNIANGVGPYMLYINPANGRITKDIPPSGGSGGSGDNWGSQVVQVSAGHINGNGSSLPLSIDVGPTGLASNPTFLINMKEKLSIRDNTDVAATTPTNGQGLIFNSATGLYEPQPVSAAAKVHIMLKASTLQTITPSQNSTIFNFIDAIGNSSTGFTSGHFAAPRAGFYQVSATISFNSLSASAGESVQLALKSSFGVSTYDFRDYFYFEDVCTAPRSLKINCLLYLGQGQGFHLEAGNYTSSNLVVLQQDITSYLSIHEL